MPLFFGFVDLRTEERFGVISIGEPKHCVAVHG